jgi:hypothetical protein
MVKAEQPDIIRLPTRIVACLPKKQALRAGGNRWQERTGMARLKAP